MKKTIILLLLYSITGMVQSQKNPEIVVRGKVFDIHNKRPLNGALIELMDTDQKAYTDSIGYFNINVIKKYGALICSSDGYITRIYSFRGPNWKGSHQIGLHRQAVDSIWRLHKNAFYLLPFELIIGSIGIQYERLLALKHSVGIHISGYLFGWGYSELNTGGETSNFTGIKIAPFYRFYLKQKSGSRFFIEGKLMAGYFDMHPLLYRYDVPLGSDLTVGRNLSFWTFGGGGAMGWAIRMPKLKNGIFNVSFGFQALALRAGQLTSEKDEYGNTHDANRDEVWWYLGGPGSVLQIKVAYGGFF